MNNITPNSSININKKRYKCQNKKPTVMIGDLKITSLSRRKWSELILHDCTITKKDNIAPRLYGSANGNVLSLMARNSNFNYLMNCFDYIDADGMSLVFASRFLTDNPLPERCATTDFFHDMAQIAIDNKLSFFLLGGTVNTNNRAIENIKIRYPDLNIVGSRDGYIRPDEEQDIIKSINQVSPDILWVGMGVPLEQSFVVRYQKQLTNVSVIKTCGGLFDFLAEKNSRAPQWMQSSGLEWLYRLILEPRRLFFRYLFTNVHTIWLILSAKQTNSKKNKR